MIDPDDPKQAKKYKDSGCIFIASIIFLMLSIAFIALYVCVNHLY